MASTVSTLGRSASLLKASSNIRWPLCTEPMAAQENYDISTSRLTGVRSASELLSNIFLIRDTENLKDLNLFDNVLAEHFFIHFIFCCMYLYGGPGEARTPNFLRAKQTVSQLAYRPILSKVVDLSVFTLS